MLETLFFGKTELPFGAFILLMQPIHLAIGLVEGLVTAAVLTFVWKAKPDLVEKTAVGPAPGRVSMRHILIILLLAVVITGGALSWFASANPDGLEWSMARTAGTVDLEVSDGLHQVFSRIQERSAFLPDYGFKDTGGDAGTKPGQATETPWPAVHAGTSLSGIVGGALTLLLAVCVGLLARYLKRKRKNDPA